LDEVIARTESTMARSNFLFILEDMSYLARGGRLPPLAARLGSALKINPVMGSEEGKIEMVSVVRTRRKAVSRMVKELARVAGDRPVHLAVMHAQVPDEAEALRQEVDKRFDCLELYVTEFTPVMGAHVGPGLLGLAYFI
jgi:DegV family protein with EDD domain